MEDKKLTPNNLETECFSEYSLASIRSMALSSSKSSARRERGQKRIRETDISTIISGRQDSPLARDLDRSVFPVPLGPQNKNEEGWFGLARPERDSLIAEATA